jgi:hypothetical protein
MTGRPGTSHQFVHVRPTPGEALAIMQPGGFEQLFAEAGSLLSLLALPEPAR